MSKLPESASQTAGPYVHIGCVPEFAGLKQGYHSQLGVDLRAGLSGDPIVVRGILYDGQGDPVLDGMIEVWQPDGDGLFHQNGLGFGRVPTDPISGEFVIETVMPGAVIDGLGNLQSPHLALWIVARGINVGLHTRIYFSDNLDRTDAVLTLVDPARVETLIAENTSIEYRFDIHLQGPNETVFFDV
jgi:protocatechuate 3,4-dioxygenase alpha subunit